LHDLPRGVVFLDRGGVAAGGADPDLLDLVGLYARKDFVGLLAGVPPPSGVFQVTK
jgi:hypothetical protein